MNNIPINPNAKTLIDEEVGRTMKLTLSSIRCGKTLMETYLKNKVVKIIGYGEDIPFATNRLDSLYQLRKEYRGHGWQRQPAHLTFNNEGYRLNIVTDNENPNCYLMVDRRELRIQNRIYRKMTAVEIREISDVIIQDFVEKFNIFGSSRSLLCEVKTTQNNPIEIIGPFAVSSLSEMEDYIAENIPYEWSDPADQLLDNMVNNVEKMGWFDIKKD